MSRSSLIAVGLIAATIGCSPAVVMVERPLLDSSQPPLVLVERKQLSLPTAGPGNRFVSGWLFKEGPDGLTIAPAIGSARVEVVRLRRRSRTLILETTGDVSRRAVTASIGAYPLEVQASSSGIHVFLPRELNLGRNLIDFEFTEHPGLEFRGASLTAAAKVGRVRVEGDDIVHYPWSAAEFVRWVAADSRLAGEIILESGEESKQRFSIAVEGEKSSVVTVFETEPDLETGRSESQSFDVPLSSTPGLVRIRLMASGRGPAGRWRNLRIVSRAEVEAAAPDPVPDPPRLVVLYVLDALRADFVGHLGSQLGATPCIDRLASEGATFSHHFAAAPNTGPSTKSLFTGYGFLEGRRLAEGGPETLAEAFSDADFATASFSANFHISPGLGLTRGFDHFDLLPLDHEQRGGVEVTMNDSAERVHGAALRWLAEQPRDESFFLYLHTLNPHNPYSPPAPFPNQFVSDGPSVVDGQTQTLVAIQNSERDVTAADEQRIRELYAANLAYNDAELCGLVDELHRRFPGEVLVVITSDHGEELFDHDGVLHGYTLYDELLRVPLVVWWPGQISPRVIDRMSGTLDLHATLRQLVKPTPSGEPGDGESLWRAMIESRVSSGEPRPQFGIAPGLRNAAMARSQDWKLILTPRPRFDWGMGRGPGRTHEAEYLFDLNEDPGEHVNRAGSQSLEADWLRLRLENWLEFWRARQPMLPVEGKIDEETRKQLEVLGYVG